MGRGVRSWLKVCPYCHEFYNLSNLMIRNIRDSKTGKVVERTDTHKIACKAKQEKAG